MKICPLTRISSLAPEMFSLPGMSSTRKSIPVIFSLCHGFRVYFGDLVQLPKVNTHTLLEPFSS